MRLRRVLVRGPSMTPTLRHGNHVLVLFSRRKPAAGTVVVVALPDGTLAVKRLVRVTADGQAWLEGDNPFGSTDSRSLGALPAEAVCGRVLLRIWPPGYVRTSR